MSDLIGKIVNLSFERLLPVGHSSQKQPRERSGTQSPLCRDLGMGEVSIRKLTGDDYKLHSVWSEKKTGC